MRGLVLAAALAAILFALEIPQPSKYDKKISFAIFNANEVFRVASANGFVSVVEFGKDERIVNIATGFSEGWELNERGNLLFIKPKSVTTKYIKNDNPEEQNAVSEIVVLPTASAWKTNLIVTTNLNIYIFELVLLPKERLYKLTFAYPQKEKANMARLKAELEKQINEDKLDASLNRVATPRNWDFHMKINENSESIAPNYAYDDGVFTYLGFDSTKTFPAAFAYELGSESILNTHIKKDGNYDVLVIHKTLPKILLRSGEKVVGILNRGYAKNPHAKTQQTSNDSEVERVLLNGKNKKRDSLNNAIEDALDERK